MNKSFFRLTNPRIAGFSLLIRHESSRIEERMVQMLLCLRGSADVPDQ